jgi:membrane protein YqaA with SNARE-associated domain
VFYLITLLVFSTSPLLQFINAEAWAVFVGLSGERPIWAVALVLGAAQTVGFALLYVFGAKGLRRIPALRRAMERLDRERLRTHAPLLLSLGALTGIPPYNALAIAAPLVDVALLKVVIFSMVGRTIRFATLCAGAGWFVEKLGISTDWIPVWLKALV